MSRKRRPATPLEKALDERIPRKDWNESRPRREQILKVSKRTLNRDPSSLDELSDIRNSQEKNVAKEFGVEDRTVADKCGRQIYDGYQNVPKNKYHDEFDRMLWEIHCQEGI